MTIPKRPIKQVIKGLPAFTTVKGGAYFFLPGLRALRYLAGLDPAQPLGSPRGDRHASRSMPAGGTSEHELHHRNNDDGHRQRRDPATTRND